MEKNNLLRIRKELGYNTMNSFADYLGVSQGTYWKWENNVSQPCVKTAVRIASKLSMDLHDVFYVDVNK